MIVLLKSRAAIQSYKVLINFKAQQTLDLLGLFYFIKFMIYKFKEDGTPMEMEVRLDSETYEHDVVEIKVLNPGESYRMVIDLTKKDVYHLIGALHLLHKEMEG